jgi:hypothetical protein
MVNEVVAAGTFNEWPAEEQKTITKAYWQRRAWCTWFDGEYCRDELGMPCDPLKPLLPPAQGTPDPDVCSKEQLKEKAEAKAKAPTQQKKSVEAATADIAQEEGAGHKGGAGRGGHVKCYACGQDLPEAHTRLADTKS